MLLIAALCFALARPRLAANRVPFGGEQAVVAVFVFDTSPSMEYTVAGTTRLDDAKRRAHELLNDLSATSQIAVFDTADDAGDDSDDWLTSGQLHARIDSLRIRPANAPVNRQIERAYRLLQKIGDREDAPPRFLFVFSDRTRESWDANAAKKSQPVEGVNTVYVDVGVDNPKDLAIDKLEIVPPVVAPGGKVTILATVLATGDKHINEISCQFDPEPESGRLPDKLPVDLAKGESRVYTFERTAPAKPEGVKEATVHVVVKLGTKEWTDALPSNNVRHATFLVRDKRKVLTLVRTLDPNQRSEVDVWRTAVNTAPGEFQCDVKTLDDAAKLDVNELKKTYHAICLFQVSQVSPQLWQTLARFVENGGGLAIVPGGDDMLRKADDMKPVFEEFNDNGLAAKVELLPARFRSLITIPAEESGIPWTGFSRQHPLTAPFDEWSHTTNPEFVDPRLQPHANRYWVVEPIKDKTTIIAAYADKDQHPALLERQVGKGRVLLFTTQLGNPEREKDAGAVRPWQTYWETTFGFALIDLTCRYLAGESSAQELNYLCGQPITVPMPPAPFSPPFTLQGPGLTQSETNVPIPDNSPTLAITQTLGPGNFTVIDGKQKAFAGFSLNIRPEEYNLERIPVEDIEAVLGKDTVLAPERSLDLRELLQKRWSPPIELLPYLMMFILLALTVESLMANFFYRRQAPATPTPAPAPESKEVAA